MSKQYDIVQSAKFKRDLKLLRRRGYDLSLLVDILPTAKAGGFLDTDGICLR